jgi:hypothetical protein
VNAQPGEPDRQPYDAADDVPDRGSVRDSAAVPPAAATWVPPESPDAGARPAWLPPGAQQPYGQAYSPHGPPGPPPYGAPPPGWQQPPPYGQPYRKPGMPRWAKIVVIIGVITYVLGFIGQMINMLVLSR